MPDGTTRRMTPDERLATKLRQDENGCLIYTAKVSTWGYGRFWLNGREVAAHRFAWELANGPIPEGMELDHLCRVRACCNVDHLEPVTHKENLRRSDLATGKRSAATHCPKGHPYSGDNLRLKAQSNGRGMARICRECGREDCRRRRKEKNANSRRTSGPT